jgi:cytochrome c oxidase subunit 3
MASYSATVQRHAFHLVDPSVMPLLSAFSSLLLTTGSVMFFHGYFFGFQTAIFGFFSVIVCMFIW